EGPAVGENFIQHFRQNQRIDDVPAQLDSFREHTVSYRSFGRVSMSSAVYSFKLIPSAAGARIAALQVPFSNDTALTAAELSQVWTLKPTCFRYCAVSFGKWGSIATSSVPVECTRGAATACSIVAPSNK